MAESRKFTEYVSFKTTKSMKTFIEGRAKSYQNRADYLRALVARDQQEKGGLESEVLIVNTINDVMNNRLDRFEDRVAKINVKNAHASAIVIFMLVQALNDLGYTDVIELYKTATKKAVAFVKNSKIDIPGFSEYGRVVDKIIEERE